MPPLEEPELPPLEEPELLPLEEPELPPLPPELPPLDEPAPLSWTDGVGLLFVVSSLLQAAKTPTVATRPIAMTARRELILAFITSPRKSRSGTWGSRSGRCNRCRPCTRGSLPAPRRSLLAAPSSNRKARRGRTTARR